MTPYYKLKFTAFLFLFIAWHSAISASDRLDNADSTRRKYRSALVFPTPAPNPKRLFYIQRDPNTNTLMYDINIDKRTGKPDAETPVNAYWVRYAEKGQKEELNYIQRKFAYGVTSKAIGNDRYDIRFVSYKKFPLILMKAADGKYHIFATVAQKLIMLSKVFIKIEGGSFWLPNVIFVEMKGTDPVTGKEVTERFKP